MASTSWSPTASTSWSSTAINTPMASIKRPQEDKFLTQKNKRRRFEESVLKSLEVTDQLLKKDTEKRVLFEKETVECVNTLEWWKTLAIIKGCIGDKELVAIGMLFTAKATSAGIERMFSSFRLVHSKLRNKSGVEKASRLVFMFKSLNDTNLYIMLCIKFVELCRI